MNQVFPFPDDFSLTSTITVVSDGLLPRQRFIPVRDDFGKVKWRLRALVLSKGNQTKEESSRKIFIRMMERSTGGSSTVPGHSVA